MSFLSKFFFESHKSRDEKNELNYMVKGYPLTTSPVLPDILKHQIEYKLMNDKYSVPRMGFTLAHEGSDLVEPESLEVIQKRMSIWFNQYPELKEYFENPLPKNLIAISFTHFNFQIGKESCHDFKLANGHKEAENSFYTYRKFSESLQCVYYNENGIEHLAGGCYYPTPYGKPMFLESSDALVYFVLSIAIPYPLEDRMMSNTFVKYKKYGRFCATAGKDVLVYCGLNDKVPSHLEYNHVANKYEYKLCDECCRDYYTYKWVKPKKVTAAIPAKKCVPVASVVTIETSLPVPSATDNSEAPAVSRSSSTESLIEGFEKIEMSSKDAESNTVAELID